MTTSNLSTVPDNSIDVQHIPQPATAPTLTTSSDVSAPPNTQNDFAPPNAPNPDVTSEVELALSSNETAVESLSPDGAARADKVITRLRSFRVKNRKATWWGFYKFVGDSTYACQVCLPLLENFNAKDKKYKKGFVKYSSAGGSSSLRRHVEDQHKTPHINVKKRLREKGLMDEAQTAKKKGKSSGLMKDFSIHIRSMQRTRSVSRRRIGNWF